MSNFRKTKIFATLTAMLLLVSTVNPVLATSKEVEEKAQVASFSKTEAIFGKLQNDGALKEAYVVNQFEVTDKNTRELKDYGNYSEITAISTPEAALEQKADEVTFKVKDGRNWYQGTLKQPQLPWNIRLHYYLDGNEIKPEELKEKSGALKIQITITPKKDEKSKFYTEHYAIQVRIPFLAEKSEQIKAKDAVIASEGKEITATYTLLPGKEKYEIEAEAQVSNFEQAGIRFTAIPLKLALDTEQQEQLQDALNQFNDAANSLKKGSYELDEKGDSLTQGGDKLKQGSSKLKDASKRLNNGIRDFLAGVSKLNLGNQNLSNGNKELADGAEKFALGIDKLGKGLALIAAQNEALSQGAGALNLALTQMKDSVPTVKDNSDQLKQLEEAGKDLEVGLTAYVDATSQLVDMVLLGKDALSQLGALTEGLQSKELPESNEAWLNALQIDQAKWQDKDIQKLASVLSSQAIAQNKLAQKLAELKPTITQLNMALKTLDNTKMQELKKQASALKDGFSKFKQGVDQLLKLASGESLARLKEGLNLLATKSQEFSTGLDSYLGSVAEIEKQVNGTEEVAGIVKGANSLSEASRELANGSETLAKGSDELKHNSDVLGNGLAEYTSQLGTYYQGVEDLTFGFKRYLNGVKKVAKGNEKLSSGVSEFRDEVEAKLIKELNKYSGKDFKAKSFVSDKNKGEVAVQFILQTSGIGQE